MPAELGALGDMLAMVVPEEMAIILSLMSLAKAADSTAQEEAGADPVALGQINQADQVVESVF